jgi:hypothetical protein
MATPTEESIAAQLESATTDPGSHAASGIQTHQQEQLDTDGERPEDQSQEPPRTPDHHPKRLDEDGQRTGENSPREPENGHHSQQPPSETGPEGQPPNLQAADEDNITEDNVQTAAPAQHTRLGQNINQLGAVVVHHGYGEPQGTPLILPHVDRSFAVDEHDHVQCVSFYDSNISPLQEHCDTINDLLYAAQSWNALLPQRQYEIRNGTHFILNNPHAMSPFELARIMDSSGGRPTLTLCQHPLLAMSPAARRALLYEWYCSNDFLVPFDVCESPVNRSYLERALILLGPRLTACLITPMSGRISPRLHIHCGNVEHGVTFASLLQWFRLFYDGPLSDRVLAGIQTGFGTAHPNPAQFTLTWTIPADNAYDSDRIKANRVYHGLRKEASRLSVMPNLRINASQHVYQWLVNDTLPAIREDLLPEARAKFCGMIGPYFKTLGYKAAMSKYK